MKPRILIALLLLAAFAAPAAAVAPPPPWMAEELKAEGRYDEVLKELDVFRQMPTMEDMLADIELTRAAIERWAGTPEKEAAGLSAEPLPFVDRNGDDVIDELDLLEMGYYPRMDARTLMQDMGQGLCPSTGDVYWPVVMVEFSDRAHTTGNDADAFETVFFDDGTSSTNSCREFYKENSYNQLFIDGTIAEDTGWDEGWYEADNTRSYYDSYYGTPNIRTLIAECAQAADDVLDYSEFDINQDGFIDFFMVVTPGHFASGEAYWPHRWALSTPLELDGVWLYGYFTVTEHVSTSYTDIKYIMGTTCHEFGHVMGLPDLYDTNGGSEGIGEWGLMGSGNWRGPSGQPGTYPTHMSPWSKIQLGWIDPIIIGNNVTDFEIDAYHDLTGDRVLKFWSDGIAGNSGQEYFLANYFEQEGFCSYERGEGIALWHIDETRSGNTDETHKLVDLEEADGDYDLDNDVNRGDAGDLYYSTNPDGDGELSASSDPDSDDYSGSATGVTVENFGAKGGTYEDCDIIVTESGSPVVTFTNPSHEDTVYGDVTVTVTTTGGSVDRVKFYIDEVLAETDTTSPWSFTWDTASEYDTDHSIRAIAEDDTSGYNGTAEITVSVETPAVEGFSSGFEESPAFLCWTSLDLLDNSTYPADWFDQTSEVNTGSYAAQFKHHDGTPYGPLNDEYDHLITDRIDISGFNTPTITWYEKAVTANYTRGGGLVRVSTDGENWDVLYSLAEPSSNTTWTERTYELDSWSGETELRISFSFTTDGSTSGGGSTQIGWVIDDVSVFDAAPATPTGLSAANGDGEVVLGWDDNSETDLDHYDVYRSATETGTYTQINVSDVAPSTYTDTSVTNETDYWYKVLAVDTDDNESDLSSAMQGHPSAAPAAPTGLTATAGDAQVALDWNDNSETDLDYYDVYRSTTETGTYTKINASDVTLSQYTDSTVTNGNTYWYKVLAVDDYGVESALSSADNAFPNGPPAAPTGLAAVNGDGTVALDWNDNSEGDLDYYDVYRSTTETGTYSKINGNGVSPSQYDDSSVTNENDYWYKLKAVDTTANESPFSSAVSSHPSATPATPTGLSALGIDAQVNLDWDDNSETDLSHYDVYRSASETGTYTKINSSDIASSSYSDTSVSNGNTYWYKVLAIDDYSVSSPLTSAVSATPNGPPAAPSGLTTTNGDGEVYLDWSDNSEGDLDYYDVYRATSETGTYTKVNSSDVVSSDYTDSSVTNETTYWYKLKAVDTSTNESAFSSAASAHPSATPAAPSGLSALGMHLKAVLDWSDNSETDLSHYDVYRSSSENGTYTKVNSANVTTSAYEDTGLINDTTYWYKLKAIDDYGIESAFSSAASATPNAPPAAPSGLATVNGDGIVYLDWSDNSESDFDYYAVYRSTSQSGTYTKINSSDVTVSNYDDSSVTNETTYWYKLKAVDTSTNASSFSSAVSAHPSAAPAAPANLDALGMHQKAVLDWDDNTESDLDFYNVYRASSSGGTYSLLATGVSASDYENTGLTNGVTWWYKVSAVDDWGVESARSSADDATPNAPPSAPTGLSATGGNGEVFLDWNDNSETDLDYYDVYRSTSETGTYVQVNASDVAVSSFTDTTVTNDTEYWYKIKAVDTSINESPYSGAEDAFPSGPPAAPAGLSALGQDEIVHLDWTDNSETDFDHYDVYRATSSGGAYSKINASDVESSLYDDSDVTNLTTYWYKLKAVDQYGIESDFCSAVSATPNPPPAAPVSLTAANGDGEVTLNWNDSSESDLDYYNVYRATSETGSYTMINPSDVESSAYTDDTATNEQTWWYKVSAVDTSDNESDLSNAASAHPSAPPSAPANLDAVGRHLKAVLDWDDNTEGDLNHYDVFRSSTENGVYTQINMSSLTDSEYTDTGLSNGVTYWYKVRATDDYGIDSAFSTADSATPNPAPAAPSGLGAVNDDGEVQLNWNDNSESDLSHYDVYRSTSESGTYLKINVSDVSVSQYDDDTVTNENTYWYKVLTVDTSGNESNFSAAASAHPSAAPSAPTGLAAVNGSSSVALDWNDNSETDFDYYDLYRAATENGSYSKLNAAGLASSSYMDVSVTNENDYWYKAVTIDDYGVASAFTSAVQAHPSAAPSAPTGLARVNGDGEVSLDWSDNSESDLDVYAVYRATSSTGPWSRIDSSDVTNSEYVDSSAVNETDYWYRVSALDDYEVESPLSSAVTAHPSAAPATPANVTAQGMDAVVVLDWEDNSETDLDHYGVYRATSSSGPYTLLSANPTASALNDTTVLNDTTYWYKLSAVDDYGVESELTSAYEAYPNGPPATPTGLSFLNGDGEVALDWNDNSDADFDHYDVLRALSTNGVYSQINSSDLTASDYLDDTALNETTYWYKLRAVDSSGNESALTPRVTAHPSAPPASPEGLLTTNGDGSVSLSWSANSESDFSHYDVWRATSETGPFSRINVSAVTGESYLDSDVTNEIDYWYRLEAVDDYGVASDPSSAVHASPSAAPSIPGGLSALGLDSRIELDWSDNPESDLSHYDVYRSAVQSGTYARINAAPVATSAYTDEGPSNGQTWWYKLLAVDDSGVESALTSAVSGTAQGPPAAPANLHAWADTEQIQLDWNDNTEPDLDHYRVYRGEATGGPYDRIDGDGTDESDYIDETAAYPTLYYYVVRAVDQSGQESADSNEVAASVNDLPQISITAPADGEYLSGDAAVSASASDDDGIVKVEFRLNGELARTVSSPPYEYLWDTTTDPDGAYEMSARAWDGAGFYADTSIDVTIDNIAPVISITAPVDGGIVSGVVAVTTDITDAGGIQRVDFFIDGELTHSVSEAPFNWMWNSASVGNTEVEIAAVARDHFRDSSFSVNVFAINLPGDANLDGIVNELDVIEIALHFAEKSGDEGYRPWIDGNLDGVIDERDLGVVGYNFGREKED